MYFLSVVQISVIPLEKEAHFLPLVVRFRTSQKLERNDHCSGEQYTYRSLNLSSKEVHFV